MAATTSSEPHPGEQTVSRGVIAEEDMTICSPPRPACGGTHLLQHIAVAHRGRPPRDPSRSWRDGIRGSTSPVLTTVAGEFVATLEVPGEDGHDHVAVAHHPVFVDGDASVGVTVESEADTTGTALGQHPLVRPHRSRR